LIYCSWAESQVALIGKAKRKTRLFPAPTAGITVELAICEMMLSFILRGIKQERRENVVYLQTARFIADRLSNAIPVHLLPYHGLGEAKWGRLDRKNETASIEIPGERQLVEYGRIFESFGLTVIMGG